MMAYWNRFTTHDECARIWRATLLLLCLCHFPGSLNPITAGTAAMAQPPAVNRNPNAVLQGDQALKNDKPLDAIKHYQSAFIPSTQWREASDSDAHFGLAQAYQLLGDHESAIHFAQQVARLRFASLEPDSLLGQTAKADPTRYWNAEMLAGIEYLELHQYSAGMDMVRRAGSWLAPHYEQMLAALLMLRAPNSDPQYAGEAMLYGRDYLDDSDNPLGYTKAMAMAAAQLGKFEIAIAQQQEVIKHVSAEERVTEERILADYQQKRVPAFEVKRTSRDKLRDKETIAKEVISSLAILEVEGKVAVKAESENGAAIEEVRSVRFNLMGAFLNRFGEIITSSDVKDLPMIRSENTTPVRADRWVEGPNVQVFACLSPGGVVAKLGSAAQIESDGETGVAVIRLETRTPYLPIPFVTPVKFQPEFRQYDDTWNNPTQTYYEFVIVPRAANEQATPPSEEFNHIDSSILFQASGKLVMHARPGGHVERRVYAPRHRRSLVPLSVAMLIASEKSETSIGGPLFNGLGECIGIYHPTRTGQTNATSIPASTCSRVASKLFSHGQWFRIHVPIIVGAVSQSQSEAGQAPPVHGMHVAAVETPYTKTYGDDLKTFRTLEDKVILSVDDSPVPTHTEWLAVMERLRAREEIEAKFVVVDDTFQNQKTITVELFPEDVAEAEQSDLFKW